MQHQRTETMLLVLVGACALVTGWRANDVQEYQEGLENKSGCYVCVGGKGVGEGDVDSRSTKVCQPNKVMWCCSPPEKRINRVLQPVPSQCNMERVVASSTQHASA